MPSKYTCLAIDSPDELLDWANTFDKTRLFVLFDVQPQTDLLNEIESGRWGPFDNLYGDLEGTEISRFGPRIVEADSAARRQAIIERAYATRKASYLLGTRTLAETTAHLRALREVTLPEDTHALFRYQDVHVTSALFPMLKPGQGSRILGPLAAWAALDACNRFHILSSTGKKHAVGALRFDKKEVAAIDEQLFVHTVAEQVRDTDSALLANLSECQIETELHRKIEKAKAFGLDQRQDQSLYCVLSFQFPAGFETEAPFAAAIRYRDGRHASFGEALDAVPSEVWNAWDERLAKDR